jgi:hypothetical protein
MPQEKPADARKAAEAPHYDASQTTALSFASERPPEWIVSAAADIGAERKAQPHRSFPFPASSSPSEAIVSRTSS